MDPMAHQTENLHLGHEQPPPQFQHPQEDPVKHSPEMQHDPHAMDTTTDESMGNTTITASTIQDMPHVYGNGSNNHQELRPQTSYSDTGFQRPYASDYAPGSNQFSPSDADTPPRNSHNYNNYNNYGQQQQPRSNSRPSSGMAGHYTPSDGGRSYSDQQTRQQQVQQESKQPSVVIKVGMVGDAQIGKTSLMVKYVEGSWDEDYIQTLGKSIDRNCFG